MNEHDTIAAIATPPGRGGIGVIRVSGRNLGGFTRNILGRNIAPRRAVLSMFTDAAGAVIDEGIALYFAAPQSYTGQDVLELQGHGGPVVLRLLLQRCVELGARVAEPGEFTRRAYLNGRLDLAQAESVVDLIDASTAQAARCAVRSLQGEFSRRIDALAAAITELRMLIEATIDFPDEDVELVEQHGVSQRLQAICDALDELLDSARQGSLLREGLHVVLAGAPNVGKSSLLNRLAGQDVAIVTDIPGTTRDAIRQVIDLGGVPAHIIDTAGLRESTDPVERLGIQRAWKMIEAADAIVLLADASNGLTEADEALFARLPRGAARIRVMNKIDLIDRAAHVGKCGDGIDVWLSAKTGEGVDALRAALLELVGWEGHPESAFLARERHLEALRGAASHLGRAAGQLRELELVAEELRLAHERLSAITGEFTADDLLGKIFSRFCIGK